MFKVKTLAIFVFGNTGMGIVCFTHADEGSATLLSVTSREEVAPATRVVGQILEPITHNTPGSVVTIAESGETVLRAHRGLASTEQHGAASAETQFRVAFTSRQFSGMSIIKLAEQGKHSLDDDIRKVVTEIPKYGTTITLRNPVNHTTGLRDLPYLNWLQQIQSGLWKLQQRLKAGR